jgi:hypothetical protein
VTLTIWGIAYEFVNDKINEIRMYYNSTVLTRQLEVSKSPREKTGA